MNEGLRSCRGALVLDGVVLHHGDCLLTSNKLAGMLRILAPAPSKGAPVRPMVPPAASASARHQ